MANNVNSLIKTFDDVVRRTSVLTEGIEGEFIKFVRQQEECRKKWMFSDQERVLLKQQAAKLKTERDAFELKLKHVRSQLDNEIKKRQKAEAEASHLKYDLSLIKDILLDKDKVSDLSDNEKQTLMRLSQYQSNKDLHQAYLDQSFAIEESTASILSASDFSFDTEDEVLDEAYGKSKRRSKRSRPSAPPITEEEEERDSFSKRTKVITEEIRTRHSRSPSKNVAPTPRLDKSFPRPSPQKNRRPPTRQHIKSFSSEENIHMLGKDTDTDDAAPTQPINKGREMSRMTTVPNLYPRLSPPPTPKAKFNTLQFTPKAKNHNFCNKTVIRPEYCGPCGKKVGFGKPILKCKECKTVCHPDCKSRAQLPCLPAKDAAALIKMKEGTIDVYTPSRGARVPTLVLDCIEEIERRGLNEVGIYRVPGSDRDIKDLKEKYLRGKSPDLRQVADIHVLCGLLKDFLRNLTEPLVTFHLYESFASASAITDQEDSLTAMYQCISELPQSNRDTMACVILHLQKVAHATVCKMNISNLAKVFGPTLVGHRCPNPTHVEMFEDMKVQPQVVERLISMPSDYWNQVMHFTDGDNQSLPPFNPGTHYPDGTPRTPQQMAESMLGPIDFSAEKQTPSTKKGFLHRTPNTSKHSHSKRKESARKHFFESPQL